MRYADRAAAGDELARHLTGYIDRPDAIVLGLVRGGVPVAARVAAGLRLPLDVLVVRKLGVPWAAEVAFGAIGPGGVVVHNPAVESRLPPADIAEVIAQEAAELSRREVRYRAGRPPLGLTGQVAIIVDDGVATGATARAAILVARRLDAAAVVLAVPVAAADEFNRLRAEADDVVSPLVTSSFHAVGAYYASFPQTTDEEVIALLPGRGSVS